MNIKNRSIFSAKIALITDSFYSINGVSKTYQRFSECCQAKKIKLDIFTPLDSKHHVPQDKNLTGSTIDEKTKTQTKGSVRIFECYPVWPIKYYYDLPPFDTRIISPDFKAKFLPNHYDLIHLATPGSLGIAARILLAKSSVPKVGVFHTMFDEYLKAWTKKGLKNFPSAIRDSTADLSQILVWQLLKWFYSKTNILLVPSKILKEKLSTLHPKIDIFPRGVDTKIFNPGFRNKKLHENLPIALYVGRLSTEKNLDLLVKIFKDRHDVKLWIVGDGPYAAGLKSQLPKAKFFGYLADKKLSEVYASSDFFIFPSVTDTFGNVILEAQASGLPVIVTNQGGPQELVKNKINGLVVNPTVKDFNQAISYLIKNPNQREIMGQQALAQAAQKDWDQAFNQLLKIYQKLL